MQLEKRPLPCPSGWKKAFVWLRNRYVNKWCISKKSHQMGALLMTIVAFAVIGYVHINLAGAQGVVYKLYTTQKGDTLSTIAKRFNISIEQLRAANRNITVDANAPLPVNQVLMVPVASANKLDERGRSPHTPSKVTENSSESSTAHAYWVYEVQRGDTWESIAKRFNVPVKVLQRANAHNVASKTKLRPGMTLLVPIIIGNSYHQHHPKAMKQRTEDNNEVGSSSSPRGKTDKVRNVSTNSETAKIFNGTTFARVGIVLRTSRIYTMPSMRSRVYCRCEPGRRLVIVDERNNWLGVLMVNGAVGWIPAIAVRLTNEVISLPSRGLSGGSALGRAIVREALRYLGVPYKYGGNSMRGIDCSALVQRVFARFGIQLPRTAAQQASVGAPVSITDLRPGDRLYFGKNGTRATHCGIYIGQGQFIHASRRHGKVTISSLYEPRYWRIFLWARR
ncbi:MAG TPA: LysM peptidoglycan-binding domain-containing protein [Armatimonadetes bacterium]|nr:LysM peptidoglycan-binding domain-containing protein [Armatimonadota bacterium]